MEMERKVFYPVLLFCVITPLLWSGCGGGSGDKKFVELCLVEYDHWEKTVLPNPDMSSLEGTYTLHSFDIDVWVDSVYIGMPVSSNDFSSFSGTLVLTTDTISEIITIEGETAGYLGTYTVSSSQAYAGTLHVTVFEETSEVICAMGPITICDPVCEDLFLVTMQSEMVCEIVPEDDFLEPASVMIVPEPGGIGLGSKKMGVNL
jgi:hypothetical protein